MQTPKCNICAVTNCRKAKVWGRDPLSTELLSCCSSYQPLDAFKRSLLEIAFINNSKSVAELLLCFQLEISPSRTYPYFDLKLA